MFTGKIRFILVLLLSLVMVFTLGVASACTPLQAQQLEGILQNVDAVSGNITIITKDGKTITLTIPADASVAIGGITANITTLERGVSVKVEADKKERVARHIEARQAEVEGTITTIVGDNITIEAERGNSVTVRVTDSTRIKFEDDFPGTLADLRVGMEVEAKFDPSTRLAFKIKVKEEEEFSALATGGWGILEIRVTDPPPGDVKSAVVYLKNIEVHKVSDDDSDNTSDNASDWVPIIGAPSSFDLMDVIGVEKILGSANITAGSFTQIRMDVDRVEGITTDNISYTAEVPGDKLKINGAFNVGGGTKTVLTLDFDGEKSLVRTGKGKFLFKPVVKLLSNNSGKSDDGKAEGSNKGQNEGKGNSGNPDNSSKKD